MKPSLAELKGEIDECTMVVGDFIAPLSEMDRFSRRKIIKDIDELNNAVRRRDINASVDRKLSGFPGGTVTRNLPATQEVWV